MESNFTRRNFIVGAAGTAGVALAATAGFASTDSVTSAVAAEAAAGTTSEAVDYFAALGDNLRGLPVPDKGWALMDDVEAPIAYESRVIDESEITSTEECDVLVIGAGVSGMIATLKAAESGAKVLCCEKMASGRNFWESAGGWNSASQREQGIDTDPAVYADTIIRAGDFRVRSENVWSFVRNSGTALDFLQEMLDESDSGIKVRCTNADNDSVKGEHTFDVPNAESWLLGPYVMDALNAVAATRENVEVRVNTAGVQLVQDAEGRVTGAIIKDEEAGTYAKVSAAKGVILSTGGYEMNPGMVKAWMRTEDYAYGGMCALGTGCTGDGHMMGLAAGAGMDPIPHCPMDFGGSYPVNNDFFHMFYLDGIAVNARGERFMNEGLNAVDYFDYTANAINTNLTRGGVWTIIDQAIVDACEYGGPEIVADYEANDLCVKADTIEELAEKLGVDAARLAATVEKWNGYFDAAEPKDEEFLRDMSYATALATPPFYAVKTCSTLLVTVSGLTIDPDSHVVDASDKVIPGLFATGNASGGIFSGQYPRHLPSTSVGRAITTGFLAGQAVVAE